MSDARLEAIRQGFRPERIRVLLLGESPPPGRGFFYTADSSLYRFTAPVLQQELGFPLEPSAFLSRFADAGWFLDDYSPTRGDKPARRVGDGDVRSAAKRIASDISVNAPVFVIGVLLSLEELVAETVAASNHPETPWRCLRFPHPRNEKASGSISLDYERYFVRSGASRNRVNQGGVIAEANPGRASCVEGTLPAERWFRVRRQQQNRRSHAIAAGPTAGSLKGAEAARLRRRIHHRNCRHFGLRPHDG